LPEWARQIVLDCCVHDHNAKYNLYVAVVMPDHVHMILTPLVDVEQRTTISLVRIMKAIKGASAHAINKKLGARGTIWQEESFGHVLRSSESLDAKIAYTLENPVRKRLVVIPAEYPWVWRRPLANPYSPVIPP
jgi:putative transposase